MYPEAAFLYKSEGDLKGGMAIYLENVKDPKAALEFAKACARGRSDDEMWRLLINHSYQHPDFLRAVLEDLPNLPINPVEYIEGIHRTDVISDFEVLAAKTVKDYQRKVRTAELTQRIVANDAFGAFRRSFDKYRAGKATHF
jgi:hypothetical protein